MKPLDLSWGSPSFLSPYWDKINLSIPSSLPTAYQPGNLLSLESAIRQLHIQEQNVDIKNKFIVVGNGASQILQAVFVSLGELVWAKPPYFSRFPILANQAGELWHSNNGARYQIITSPNNPDGKEFAAVNPKNTILDLSYNWKQYTVKAPIKHDHPICIFSLAKATGHASTRIGWAVLEDEKLAKDVQQYIENSTCGVSIEAQHKAAVIIKSQFKRKKTVFEFGRKILKERWKTIQDTKFNFNVLNNSGMFLWVNDSECGQLFHPFNIKPAFGSPFGMDELYALRHSRINIGCSESEFKEFIKRMSK